MPWDIVAKPVGHNDDEKNEGGIVILLKDQSGREEEVGRVAFAREHSTNPDTPFNQQLDRALGTAKQAVAKLNELTAGAGELQ